MKKEWGELPEWQRQRAQKLHAICLEVASAPSGKKLAAIAHAVKQYDGIMLSNGAGELKPLRLSVPTLRRAVKAWANGGGNEFAFELGYCPARRKVPRDLIIEWKRRLTTPGTTHDGRKSAHDVYNKLKAEWNAGFKIPGLGTWQEWWTLTHQRNGKTPHPNPHHNPLPQGARESDLSLPTHPPRFPFSYSAMLRYRPDVATAALGNLGIAAARDALSRITRDSSELRPCEIFALDDVKADVVTLDDWSGELKLIEPTLYLMMEIGSRFIAGFVTRGTDAILQSDVDALIAHVLGSLGIGNGYATHILFERGTVACSEARQVFLEGMFPGRIYIHRTGMNNGAKYPGAYVDKSSGKPCSKGMIEAFMRKLHLRLSALPGQTGSNQRVNEPAEMDARKREAETLAYIETMTGVKLEGPVLRLSQFNAAVRMAIEDYNNDRNHSCQGFHKALQVEVQPGVFTDVPQITSPPSSDYGATRRRIDS
jgi:hypothetical protein